MPLIPPLKPALFSATLLLAACASTTQQGAVGVKRSQLMLVSSSQSDALGLQYYRGEQEKARSKQALNTDRALLERLRVIADRLVPQVAVFRPDAVGWQWEVNLESRNELNAYCAPGGKIMFFSGIVTQLKLTDDEIAAIMGHEIAHALREHSRERMSQAYAQNVGMSILTQAAGIGAGGAQIMQLAAQVGLTLPHSRGQESEADVIGLELLARAGYNPNAAVTLWQKMGQATGGGKGSFMSTHPSSTQRIGELSRRLPQVMPLYEQARSRAPSVRQVIPRTSAQPVLSQIIAAAG